MKPKNKRAGSVPLEAVITSETFKRNYKMLIREGSGDHPLTEAIADLLVENAQGGIHHKKTQSANASAPKKLPADQQTRIAQTYWEKVAAGEKYGVVKALAAAYDVSTTTINTITRKYKPK